MFSYSIFFTFISNENIRGNYMFTTFMVSLFIFTTTKETFSKIHFSLSDKKLVCPCYYIYNT